jgi:hypothetical protein
MATSEGIDAGVSFAFSQLLEKATADPIWARLLVQSLQAPTEFARSVRANLKADLTDAKAQDQLAVQDVELAVDIINWGIASGHARYFSTKASGRSVTPGS